MRGLNSYEVMMENQSSLIMLSRSRPPTSGDWANADYRSWMVNGYHQSE
jgi:hypothetical protein